jgi:hypothetical protein
MVATLFERIAMQVFILDEDISSIAEGYFDCHIVKIPLEIAQILCTTIRSKINFPDGAIDPQLYKMTHINHPWVKWSMESWMNFNWLANLHEFLTDEYSYRYRKIHGTCTTVNRAFEIFEDNISLNEIEYPETFPLCMPDQYKSIDVVKSYRQYYLAEKMHLCKYTNRPIPDWMKECYEKLIPRTNNANN